MFYGIDSNETSAVGSAAHLRPDENKLPVNEGPPCCESLKRVHSIYNPNQMNINDQMHRILEIPPPDYEKIDLSN